MTKINREQLTVGQEVFTRDAFNVTKLLGTVVSNEAGPADGRTNGVVHLGSWKKTILRDAAGNEFRFNAKSCWVEA